MMSGEEIRKYLLTLSEKGVIVMVDEYTVRFSDWFLDLLCSVAKKVCSNSNIKEIIYSSDMDVVEAVDFLLEVCIACCLTLVFGEINIDDLTKMTHIIHTLIMLSQKLPDQKV